MNRKILVFLLVLFSFFAGSAFAKEGQLYLFKDQTFDSSPILQGVDPHGDCDQLFKVSPDKDVADMRDFDYYFCEGMYTLRLDGPKGMMVTLFGNFFFNKEEGFLVLKKLDDQLLWLLDLEDFPSGKWVNVAANKDSGAFAVYYYPAANFRKKISSLRWGQWWQGETPTGHAPTPVGGN